MLRYHKFKQKTSHTNSSLKTTKKIMSIFIVFILITTTATSIIGAANLLNGNKPLREKLNNLKEKTEDLLEDISELKNSRSETTSIV